MSPPRVLVIAGSDSSGGAGLEADQKVLAAHGCYAMTATTALTAQNTTGVSDIHVVPPAFLKKQIKACLEDIGADVVKIGMLASKESIDTVAECLHEFSVKTVVLDPVMVATSGAQLLPQDAVATLTKKLLGLTTILTPNIPEARLLVREAGLAGTEPENLENVQELAKKVQSLGPRVVLLKGGHMPLDRDNQRSQSKGEGDRVVDVLFDGSTTVTIESPYSPSKNTHGTGCSLASAIAANIAKGATTEKAVRAACTYVETGIRLSFDLGQGSGPINHFHSLQYMPFPPGHFLDYLLDRDDVKGVWKKFMHHKFALGLGDGTLPLNTFKRYLVQDYLYLTHFARSNALAAYKSRNVDTIAASAAIVLHIQTEMKLHLDYCQSFGLSKADIENQKESLACVAYSRYILDVGQSEDWIALQVALAPCLIGYGRIAQRLHQNSSSLRKGNPYWKWIENYVANDYTEAVRIGSEALETHMIEQSPSRIEELVQIFNRSTEMEIGFWHFEAHATEDEV